MRIAFLLLGLAACLPNTQLEVTKSGAGSGTVTSDPSGINCGDACMMSMDAEGVIELVAKPAEGDAFRGWSGDCSGIGTCTIDSSFSAEVDARFDKVTTMTVQMKGAPANVEVRSMPAGLTCVDGTCTGQFVRGTDVVLTTIIPPMLHFDGWSGACGGTTATCTIRMGDEPVVAAIAFRTLMPLTVTWIGNGSLSTGNASCGFSGCAALIPEGDSVVVHASYGAGTNVTWTGECAGNVGNTCTVTMNRAKTVGASFQ
jgi:hypothetical protein